jgi:uncharacterized repeat protein (TIGR01451 family)
LIAFAVVLTVAGVSTAAVTRQARSPVFGPDHKQVICHFNQGKGGSFNLVDVDVASIVKGTGHGAHVNDIIPPFDYDIGAGLQHYPGRNWDTHVLGSNSITGEDVWNDGCSVPTPPAGSIRVIVRCVSVNHAAGTYDAVFGYSASLPAPVTIAAGSTSNSFAPAPADRGQPSTFEDGLVYAAVTVNNIPIADDLTWSVTYGSQPPSTATATSDVASGIESCDEQPPPDEDVPIGVFVTCVVNHGRTYDAVFGYQSQNADAEEIAIGEGANDFSPAPADRGQPTIFEPGLHAEAIVVRGIPSRVDLTWTVAWVDTRSAIASPRFPQKCHQRPTKPPAPPPPPPPPPSAEALPIGVFVACVINHDSHYDAMFAYVNENSEVVSVPIGPDNAVSPGAADQGQPEAFHPGFLNRAFTVTGVSAADDVTWTVRIGDEVRVARAAASFPHKCLDAPIDPVANAAVTKSARPGTVTVGARVGFTIVVRNTGSAVLRPARVTDTLPAGLLHIVSASSTLGSCRVTTAVGSPGVECSAPALAPGQSLTINVAARATAAGSASDHAALIGVGHATASATVHITSRGAPPPPPVTG